MIQLLRSIPGLNRREPRRATAMAALWQYEGGRARGVITDVSSRGLFLRALGPLAEQLVVGTRVQLLFLAHLDGHEQRIAVTGHVCWMAPEAPDGEARGVGIELEDAPELLAQLSTCDAAQLLPAPALLLESA
jgi:hypothetical protein